MEAKDLAAFQPIILEDDGNDCIAAGLCVIHLFYRGFEIDIRREIGLLSDHSHICRKASMSRQIIINRICIPILIFISLFSCQPYVAKWDNDAVGLEKEIYLSSHLFDDLSQSEDENSDLLSGFAEGPFPKVPNQYSEAERLNHLLLEKYSKLEVSDDSIETIYRQVVVLENYFRDHAREPNLEKNGINQDVIIQAYSESSHVLQYLLYKKFATIKTNRYEEGSLNSMQSVLHTDKKGRDAMLICLHALCEKYGYTLTAYMWSAKDPMYGSNKAKNKGTEALNYFLDS